MMKSKNAKVTEDLDAERFDIALVTLFPEMSRKSVQRIIDSGGAYIDKKRVLFSKHQVFFGQKLEIFWDEKPAREVDSASVRTSRPLCILQLHSDFAVVRKSAGIPSQATLTDAKNTIVEYAARELRDRGENPELHLVHRLDKETSGLLILARNKKAQAQLESLFRERLVKKLYLALTFRIPRGNEGVVDVPIGKHPMRPNAMQIAPNGRGGAKSAFTRWRTVQTFSKSDSSAFACQPESGRTHQIRVHLQYLGCPLLGDKTYAQQESGHPLRVAALRHMLHAAALRFDWNGEAMEFHEPMPVDMRECLERMGDDGSVAATMDQIRI